MPFSIATLLGRELADGGWRRLLLLAAISGLASAAVLAIINLAASSMRDADVMANALLLLVIALLIYIYSQSSLMLSAASVAEQTVHQLRLRLLQTLSSAELVEVEGLNRNEIFTCISTEMRVISDGATSIMIFAQSLVLAVVTLGYLAFLSLIGFLIAAAFIGIASYLHAGRNRQIIDRHEQIFKLNTQMLDSFSDLVDGFKEVRLNSGRAVELSDEISQESGSLSAHQLEMQGMFSRGFVAAQVNFFLLTAIMVFILPMFASIESETLPKITATTLFLIGPISAAVAGLPALQRLNAAADAIMNLEGKLHEIGRTDVSSISTAPSFATMGMAEAEFHYPAVHEERSFGIGPATIEIKRGSVVFITGGNGSGKSTLLKLLTGLYRPVSGALVLDGKPLADDQILGYRNLFSPIFADHHLFRQFYGIPASALPKADEYIRLMELEDKVSIVNRAFSTLNLSSGQRKRLVLIVALLEDRPVYIFDEWAADQDPHFRQKFYHVIIPLLKSNKKTVVAVTHDERYFDVADTRYYMEEGRLRLVDATTSESGL
jgi:putative pyoverdin transport system ATP-binding/permease protein